VIRKNRVVWSRPWTEKQIREGREEDAEDLRNYYKGREEDAPSEEPEASEAKEARGLTRLWRRRSHGV